MTTSIAEWLKTLDLEQYARVFSENEVDLKTLKVLTDDDLKELGLPFGPRKRLLNAINEVRQADISLPGAAAVGERRQLTVLFCDMVGFTELASRVDPEVLQTIIRIYENACAKCIERYDGYVFQRLGDGIVAFFGFPQAHEDEAERAIQAGLQIVETMAHREVPEVGYLKVRIGIATGMVVVAAGERGAVGETMNLAARLQGTARPGNIVVSERVHRLAGGVFDFEDLGEHALKGIARPTRAYHVRGVSAAASRFDAATHKGMTVLVGREHEVGVLLERWQLAQGGAGQVVLLAGEPGIGKSRIVSVVRERLEAEGANPLRFQCSPFHVNSAFHPVSVNFERALDFGRDEPAASKLDKLEAMIVRRNGLALKDVRFIAAMLSIPCEERYGPLAITPRLAKQETVRALVDLVTAIARARPSFVLFEDVHWADPTTLQVLDLLIERLDKIPLLVVFTSRPEFEPRWSRHDHVVTLNLAKLTRAQSGALVSRLAGGKTLPAELLDQILEKTDGVPLFVEEMIRAILESGDLQEEGNRYVYAGTSASVAIPETLRDSLMARLDRVASIKQIAQVGAAIGREFSYELIAALDVMSETSLADALTLLTASGLAAARGTIPHAVYTFKHALVQDTAYDSLLKSQRQPLHGKIARVIEERWPDIRDTEPELLAHHYTAAGLNEAAVPFWRKAGEVAMQRFALPEAVTHLRKGMTLVETLAASSSRDLMELQLRTVLGPAVVAQRGWGHEEVSRIIEPAWALAESLEHRPSYLPILNALWVHYLSVDRLAVSLQWAEKLLAAGTGAHDDNLTIVGHRAVSASYFWLGDFIAARRHGDIVHSMYDAQRHWHIAQLTNTDPLTGESIYRAQYLWMLGFPDQAAAASDARDAHARRRNHPFDLAFSLTLGAQAFDFRCESERLLQRTEEAERVGREHGVALLWEVLAELSRSIALLRSGHAADSVVKFERTIPRLTVTGHRIWIWYLRALQAEGIAESGDLERAMAQIDECVEGTRQGEDRAHYAEVLRLKGCMLMRQGRVDDAERSLRAAIDVARGQQAKSWELRATTSLARLLAARGDHAAAHAMLTKVYAWFTEGFDTKDLRDAKALLDVLAEQQDRPVQNLCK